MDSIVVFGAKYLFLLVIVFWILAWRQAAGSHKKQLVWATIFALILAAILDKIVSKLYYDPRPFVTHHIAPLITHTADNGFPSEHTLFSMTIAATLLFFRPKLGMVAIAAALLVGIARVAANVHSPIDIAGGALIGFAAGYTGYWIALSFFPAKTTHRAGGQPASPK
jgi:undecaprenyl-diphosphatase